MTTPAAQAKSTPETHLQRTLNSVLNDVATDSALAAIYHQENGPLIEHASRGFTPRDTQSILRTLLTQTASTLVSTGQDPDGGRTIRLRLITPGAKSLLGIPLRHLNRVYGYLVIGRKEGAAFAKKEKALLEQASDGITKALDREGLFNTNVVMSRPYVAQEPVPPPQTGVEMFAAMTTHFSPELQGKIEAVLIEANQFVAYDRAWACYYDPLAGNVEVLGIAGDTKGDQKDAKKDLKPGQRLTLDSSAAGWAVRHRKPRVDHDLASTQGRFLDHKHLFKDRFLSSLVVPFFVRGQVGGTFTLGSKEPQRYQATDARTLEPIILKLADLLQTPVPRTPSPTPVTEAGAPIPQPLVAVSSEPIIRKQERQAAIGEFSAFLATEIREPLASIRAQLEEVTGEGILDFDPQTRVENAMRDLIRIEAILNEILDFAKPLELNRHLCRIPEILESALVVVGTDLEATRIHVTKDYANVIAPVRGDEAKLQQAFLSIFKNAGEAMTPGGHLHIQVSHHRAGRGFEVQILIKNDGSPIPAEIVDKVFEPFFTTKRSGIGLGLPTVKKIVEEHGGSIAIGSSPGEGTTVTIRLPGVSRGPAFRHRGRNRRPHRRPN
ncbi:MAG: GAF domain-containing sensor histidine kinase [Nitrospirae bacterium]|nr:GAF domain-containing sensor histidine kinase [Nitrospirota bacterium]